MGLELEMVHSNVMNRRECCLLVNNAHIHQSENQAAPDNLCPKGHKILQQ